MNHGDGARLKLLATSVTGRERGKKNDVGQTRCQWGRQSDNVNKVLHWRHIFGLVAEMLVG